MYRHQEKLSADKSLFQVSHHDILVISVYNLLRIIRDRK